MKTSRTLIRRLASPSTILAIVAIVVATGGTAYAAIQITGKNVLDGTLSGRDVRNGTIARNDLAADARRPATTVRSDTALGFEAEVRCQAGEVALGGGGKVHGSLHTSEPIVVDSVAVGWRVQGTPPPDWQGAEQQQADGPVVVADPAAHVHAICAAA